jgi:hypothetical protein
VNPNAQALTALEEDDGYGLSIFHITTFLKKLPHQASMDMGCHIIYIYDLFEGVSTLRPLSYGNLKLPKREGGGGQKTNPLYGKEKTARTLYRKPQALIHMYTGSSAFSL